MPRWLTVLILFLPAAIIAGAVGASPLLVFILAALALIPLSGLISVATEQLAEHFGERVGGLLNATFGNAAELIIGFFAIADGLPTVVRASISGSIIGNALLVLGTSMLVGGWRHGTQRFSAQVAGQYAAMLGLAVVGLVIPSIIAGVGGFASTPAGNGSGRVISQANLHELSLIIAVVLLISYGAYISYSVFGLRTEPDSPGRESGADQGGEEPHARARQDIRLEREHAEREAQGIREDPPERAHPRLYAKREDAAGLERAWLALRHWYGTTIWGPLTLLAAATVLTAVASEILVGAIEPVSEQVGLGQFFVGLIVLPIVGNAAEHTSAITAALHNRMETTMAITAGSAIQVALLVAPVLVIVSSFTRANLNFDFNGLELVIFALVALLYALVSLDGESTWLEGVQLAAFYIIVAVTAYFVPA